MSFASSALPRTSSRAAAGVSTLVLLGAAGLVATAAIHFAEAPGTFEDGAYLGVAFIAQGIAALVAAVMAVRGSRLGILAECVRDPRRSRCGDCAVRPVCRAASPSGRPPVPSRPTGASPA